MPVARSYGLPLPDALPDPVAGRHVVIAEQRMAIAIELLPQGTRPIFGLVDTAPLQFGHHKVHEVAMRVRHDRIAEVEAIDARVLDPRLHRVRYLFRRAHDDGALATDRVVPRQFTDRPY